ncbi:MAG TPA: crossover junction endodeoxyribonuclease RuvC [Bacteriovoracaceae bacterium]|nr:crossover junction endodeoxyribonuclease RuvC [Bacteriovoracaceae bacterium]
MIVLAIDPGSVTAGYAILQKEGRKINYLTSGILKFKAQDDGFLDKVKDIYDQTMKLLDQYTPDEIALESLIFVKSPTALIKLAQSRGVMLAALAQKYDKKIFEYSPNTVKATVTGHGHADKEGIQKVLGQQLGITEFKSHDESDALAIALCHLLNHGQFSVPKEKKTRSKQGNSLASALAHKLKEPVL